MLDSSIRFVGQESSYGVSPTPKGSACWSFIQPIDQGIITIGSTIVILRYHPLHQNNLESAQGVDHTSGTRNTDRVLLRGRVRALNGVKERDVFYIVDDHLNNQLAVVRIPIKHTNVDEKGGWRWFARPVRWGRWSLLWHPAYISESDIWGPGALAARQARERAERQANRPLRAHELQFID